MRVLLVSLALLILLPAPTTGSAPNPPIDLRTVFASLQPDDCTTNPELCNDNNSCTSDACMTGTCVHQAVPNGSPCTDGSACTTGDTCQSGQCIGTPIACEDNDLCTLDSCDGSTGACVFAPACDDGIICTVDTCDAGTGACSFQAEEGAFDAPVVLISAAETGIKLTWAATGAEHYEVHRSTNPYFLPSIATFVTNLSTPPFVYEDPGVLDDTTINYDYGVLAVCNNYSKRSGTGGEFGYKVEAGK